MKKSRYILISFLFAAVSCVYPYKVPESVGEEEYMVVDGSIIVGKYATLQLNTLTRRAGRYSSQRISPDSWWVEEENGTKYEREENSNRVDLSSAPADRAYRMVIKVNGRSYCSSFQKGVEAPRITDVRFEADEEVVHCYVSLEEGTSGTGYMALSFDEIWKFHTMYKDSYVLEELWEGFWSVSKRPQPDTTHYWCWRSRSLQASEEKIIDVTHLDGKVKDYPVYSFVRGNDRNHGDYNIKVFARSISETEYRFQKNLDAPEGGYNLFTPNPGEIAGNVICEDNPSIPTLGYVTLSVQSSREANLDGKYYKKGPVNMEQFVIISQDEIPIYYFEYNFRPVFEQKNDNMGTDIYWGELRCVDCVADGGSLQKPSFD